MPATLSTRLRIAWYRRQWTAQVEGTPVLVSPALLVGPGRIRLTGPVTFGWELSPRFHDGYTYIEARSPTSVIEIGAGSHFNNAVTMISEGPGIRLGQRCLVGPQTSIVDSDFHANDPRRRHDGSQGQGAVVIGDDVFIGGSVNILKGVHVGDGSVIGAGSVVSRDVPAGVVVAGNPAQIVSHP